MILGGKEFIRETLETVKDKALGLAEISHGRQLQASWTVEEAVEVIARELKVDHEEVLRKAGVSRNSAIYLMKRHTGMSNRQIGELCGGMSYSAVTKAHQRFSHQAGKDSSLRKKIDRIADQLSHVKTPLHNTRAARLRGPAGGNLLQNRAD